MDDIMNSDELNSNGPAPRLSPYCQHLSSKKLMIAEEPPLVDRDVLDASQHAWCGVTYKVLGPDGFQCGPEDCRKGRECFQSPLAELL